MECQMETGCLKYGNNYRFGEGNALVVRYVPMKVPTRPGWTPATRIGAILLPSTAPQTFFNTLKFF